MNHTVFINGRQQSAPAGALLSDVLRACGYPVTLECGGNGGCGRCGVLVDGKFELSCQYRIYGNISVKVPKGEQVSESLSVSSPSHTGAALLVDIGTTTLALKLIDAEGHTLSSCLAMNPQRRFGLDVVSRISYCTEHGISECRSVLIDELRRLIEKTGVPATGRMYVAGNTAMLHIFRGFEVASLGIFPYTPVTLDAASFEMPEFSDLGIKEVIVPPCAGAFIGADALCGLYAAGKPEPGKWKLLCDLGTNAEILLWSSEKLYAASAAAGPCFEGAGLSCGMPALPGAICGFAFGGQRSTAGSPFVDSDHRPGWRDMGTYVENARRLVTTVGGEEPRGICGTGLFDIAASLLDSGLCKSDGLMPAGDFELYSSGGCRIVFTQKDMRQFQLAKAAVAACIELLISRAGISCSDISQLYVSGGFSSKLNMRSAARTGLFPAELCDRAVALRNSCLEGLALYSREDVTSPPTVLVDPSLDPSFQSLYLSHLAF